MGSHVELTPERRAKVREYYRQGYTAVFGDADTGELLPGYVDWSLEFILDELENPLPRPPRRCLPCTS